MNYKNPNTGEEIPKNNITSLVVLDVITLESLLKTTVQNAFESLKNNTAEKPKSEPETANDLLNMENTLSLLKVSKMTIHNWKKKGLIQAYKVGRKLYFKKSELINALKVQKFSVLSV